MIPFVGRVNPQIIEQVRAPRAVSTHSTSVQAKVVSDPSIMHDVSPDGHFKVPTQTNVSNQPEDHYEHLARQISLTIERLANPYEFDEQVGLIKHQFRKEPFRDIKQFRDSIKSYSKGSSAYELALLLALRNELTGEALNTIQQFIRHFLKYQEAELQAYLNVADVIEAHTNHAHGTELAGAYEQIVTTTTSVMQALGALVKHTGVEQITPWSQFLTQACVKDLCAINIGSDRIHLMFILQELKSFKILNTFLASLKKVQERFFTQQTIPHYVQTSFDYIEQPIHVLAIIEKWCSASSTQEQILFFQNYKQIYYALVDEAYQSEEQKQNALAVLQQHIDEMIYSED